MIIYVFGNPDLPEDALPIRILPKLRREFPDFSFEVKEPNEEWDPPEELVVIDTAIGIKEVTVFPDLSKFTPAPRITMHDFDALANLRLLVKLGKIKKVTVIGIPPTISESDAVNTITRILSSFNPSHNPH
jgi:hypothetical protein